ncbi:hypothetical protein AAVH_16042 [Aphelenchoides avenae]|nr:hypothetical protein AAVH_16042 [Aphelenchus avenae]
MSDVMLPTETTTDILSFLGLFDLSGTLLANEKLRDIAGICSKRMKRWTFRVVRLRSYASGYKGHTQIAFWYADDTEGTYEMVTCPTDKITELLLAAFRNVVADSIDVSCCSCRQKGGCLMDALRMLPPKSAVARQLALRASCIRGVSELFEMVDRFRGVRMMVLEMNTDSYGLNGDELLAQCRQRGLQKLLYGHHEFLFHI